MYALTLRAIAVSGLIALGLAAKPTTPPPELGGPSRALTSISTDKPIYRGGERVYVRGVVLNAFRHAPVMEWTQAQVEIRGPRGNVVASGPSQAQEGTWSFAWDVPPNLPGGEYTIKVTYPHNGHAPAERKFDVRAYRAPRLKTQITFLRDGYGPGDSVTATVEVTRAEGGIPTGAQVTATARVDGVEVARVPSTVDARGLCTVTFQLPSRIDRGEGALAFAIQDGGVVETATKTIPILLQTVDLALYPEGGDLVTGVTSRVYFEARTPAQKPADIAGEVLDERTGARVARFRSEHEGRGRFEFRPARGVRYVLRLTEPAGISRTFPLPDARREGAVLRALQDAVAPGQSVRFAVRAPQGKTVKLVLSHREVELASARLTGPEATVTMDPKDAEGVLTATLYSASGEPLAERLVLRRPRRPLEIQLTADRERSAPGSEVTLTARATVNGQPVAAWIGLTVTDDAVLQLVEKREQAPQLPTMALLEPEVRELADAHLYLDPKNPRAALQSDLLLGTQGWRRFALADTNAFVAQHKDAARRALALRVPPPPMPKPLPRPGGWGGNRGALVPMAAPGMARNEMAPAAPPPPMPAEPMAMPEGAADAPADALAVAEPAPEEEARPVELDKDDDHGGMALGELESQERVAGKALARRDRAKVAQRPALAYVREYAHQARAGRKPNDRVDFAETLYWSAALRTDPKTGAATVRFALSDSVTSFKAVAGGYTGDGSLGAAEATVQSVQPFYLEPKLPLEVSAGDVVQLPLSMVNGTDAPLGSARVRVQAGPTLRAGELSSLSLRGGERARQLLRLEIGHGNGPAKIAFEGAAGNYQDRVERTLSVKPSGFPFQIAFGGMLGPQKPATHRFSIPEGVAPGSIEFQASVFPTPLANMTQALSRLIQEPSGCFEQTSSTTYPMTMAQQYFLTHQGVDPALVKAAREKLERGYQRLVGFECSEKGYEWFGENPGHEALTAYGLLHFTDMAKVRPVDQAMLAHTRAWLLKQRDGSGGFERKRRALHTWVEDKDSSNAYITWALLESGVSQGLTREVQTVKDAGGRSSNSYVTALAANVAWLGGHKSEARSLMQRLSQKQAQDGSVQGGTQSIVGSGGEALLVETTSLAALAWLRDPAFAPNVERAIRYLAENCEGGRYGSTQSTVLALRAIVAYDQARAHPKRPGTVRLLVDGKPVGPPVRFDQDTKGAIQLPDAAEALTRGAHTLALRMEGGAEMPYAVSIRYNASTPDSSRKTKVSLEIGTSSPEVTEGELFDAVATVTNRTQEKLPTVVAIVGVPGGLEPRHDQLKELVKKGAIDAYEVKGRDVVLYWRGMEPGKSNRVPLSLVAAVPGRYTGPASRAYLYYTDEDKVWVKGLSVTVAPKR